MGEGERELYQKYQRLDKRQERGFTPSPHPPLKLLQSNQVCQIQQKVKLPNSANTLKVGSSKMIQGLTDSIEDRK